MWKCEHGLLIEDCTDGECMVRFQEHLDADAQWEHEAEMEWRDAHPEFD